MPACNPELPHVGADAAGCRAWWHACIHARTHRTYLEVQPSTLAHARTRTDPIHTILVI